MDNLRVVDDEVNNTHEEELDIAIAIVVELVHKFTAATGLKPTKIHVSDDDELQSFIMYAANICGIQYERTHKKTYVE